MPLGVTSKGNQAEVVNADAPTATSSWRVARIISTMPFSPPEIEILWTAITKLATFFTAPG
jgi:hypothetical protein